MIDVIYNVIEEEEEADGEKRNVTWLEVLHLRLD